MCFALRVPNRLSALLATVLCAGLLAACGDDDNKKPEPAAKTIDAQHVARSIEDTIAGERNITAKVTCPAGVEQKKGVKFTCTAKVKGEADTPFEVTVTDDAGAVDFVAK